MACGKRVNATKTLFTPSVAARLQCKMNEEKVKHVKQMHWQRDDKRNANGISAIVDAFNRFTTANRWIEGPDGRRTFSECMRNSICTK